MKHDISKRRLLFGTITGFLVVMLVTGLMMAPTLGAAAWKGGDDDDKDKNKCGKKHKYDGICDRTPPNLTVSFKKFKDTCTGKNCIAPPVLITGTAFDSDSGIKLVQVCINDPSSCTTVSTSNGPWSFFTPPLTESHEITVRAVDNANNFKRIHIFIEVIQLH